MRNGGEVEFSPAPVGAEAGSDAQDERIRTVRGALGEVVLACRKCTRRVGGGFGKGRRRPLAKMLRKALGAGSKPSLKRRHRSRPVVMETGCLGLCPKGAVVALRLGCDTRIVIVRPGADPRHVARALGMDGPDRSLDPSP